MDIKGMKKILDKHAPKDLKVERIAYIIQRATDDMRELLKNKKVDE